MSTKKTIGGNRLGSGKKMTVALKNYERSTHDLSYLWRSTMAAGTLVPFMSEVGLPGDTFDINLDIDMKTHPTIGPLFGSYKIQVDVFSCPVRLYQGQLNNNKLGVGMNMSAVKLPQIEMKATKIDPTKNADNQQINPSSIFSYLNIRGLAREHIGEETVERSFNAIPYLAYWDIYKNYYANKQEEIGAVIHRGINVINKTITLVTGIDYTGVAAELGFQGNPTGISPRIEIRKGEGGGGIIIDWTGISAPELEDIFLITSEGRIKIQDVFTNLVKQTNNKIVGSRPKTGTTIYGWDYLDQTDVQELAPRIHFFELNNIDEMRENILNHTTSASAYIINDESIEPYNLPLLEAGDTWTKLSSQEGLALKTYQSDQFNNWLSTEWIDGDNGISAITAIDTSEGNFTIDTLNLSRKVYDMLNRIAISGGSYDDWLDAVYTHDRMKSVSTPMYMGGLIRELAFQEVISNAEATGIETTQPLGTLAGKGVMSGKKKGGNITVKIDEPSYIIGIVSLTPRVDYSQGNKWDVNLKTMDDFHKPALDEIGFQDLITDQMAWWDTMITPDGTLTYRSAGKQPAWINYMTNVNQVRGNFAIEENEMFMTLNRRYEVSTEGGIGDLTTYIDPMKFNHIFAQTSRDAQNFWAQISVDITARRKMSAKIMPNL